MPHLSWSKGWLLALPGISYVLALALTGVADDDAFVYHATIPSEYLRHASLWFANDNPSLLYPPLGSMIYAYGMALGSMFTLPLLHAGFLAASIAALVLPLRARLGTVGIGAAVLLILAEDITLHGASRANTDFFATFFIIAAVAMFSSQLARPDPRCGRSVALLCGLFLGAAFATKYTSAVSLVAFGALVPWALARKAVRWPLLFPMGIAFFLPVLPFLVRNFLVIGDPLAPMFASWNPSGYGLTQVELAARKTMEQLVYSGTAWSRVLDSWWKALYFGEFGRMPFDACVMPFWLISMVYLLRECRRNVMAFGLLIYLLVAYVVWAALFPTLRYAMPMLFLLNALFPLAIKELALGWIPRERMRNAVMLALVLPVVGLAFSTHFLTNAPTIGMRLLTFLRVNQDYGRFVKDSSGEREYLAAKLVKEEEPACGRVYMLYSHANFFLSSQGRPDALFTHMETLKRMDATGSDPISWLRDNGYCYVFFDFMRLSWLAGSAGGASSGRNIFDENAAFFTRRIKPRLEFIEAFPRSGGLEVYRVPRL